MRSQARATYKIVLYKIISKPIMKYSHNTLNTLFIPKKPKNRGYLYFPRFENPKSFFVSKCLSSKKSFWNAHHCIIVVK